MPSILYFCDESSFHDDYMAVGGLAVNRDALPYIIGELERVREECNFAHEVKWENAKSRRVSVHRAYVNLLFRLIEEGRAHLHVRFAPFGQYDHSLSGEHKRAATVGKMHYQLLLHRAMRFYGDTNDLYIYPDNGRCTEELPKLRDALNVDGQIKLRLKSKPVQYIECRDSKSEPMLQLLDVTLGALTAYRNDRHLDDEASIVKRDLAKHAFEKTDLKTLEKSCPFSKKKLNVWNVLPMWEKGGHPRR